MTPDHYDAFAVLGVGLALLLATEWRLRSLFARHEVKEEKMHTSAVLLAEGVQAGLRDALRHIEEIRLDHSTARIDISNLGEVVRMHDGRLGAIEEKLMRAALAVPSPRRPPYDPDAS